MTDCEPTETDAPALDQSYHLGDDSTIPKIYEQIEHAGSRGDDYRENLDDPEDEALNDVVEGFSLIMGAFKEGTIGELDGESIAWGITNACYRQLERIRKEHNDVESDLKRLGRMRLDGMEVHVRKLEQRQAQAHHLEKRMVFLEMVHKAAIAVHDESNHPQLVPAVRRLLRPAPYRYRRQHSAEALSRGRQSQGIGRTRAARSENRRRRRTGLGGCSQARGRAQP